MNRRVRFMLVLAVFAVFAMPALPQKKAVAPKDSRAADEKAVRDTDATFAKAAAEKNLDKIVSFYADDAWLLEPGVPAHKTKASIREAFKNLLATPGLSIVWHPTRVDVARSGDLAYTSGEVRITTKDATGKSTSSTSKYLTVWKKQSDGSWKAVVDIDNEDAPPPAPAPPAAKKKQ